MSAALTDPGRRQPVSPKTPGSELRQLLGLAGLLPVGLLVASLPLFSAVSAFRNEHRFAHAPHVAAVVETTGKAKGLYVQIGLRYSVGGQEYVANVQDPNAVDERLTQGETVDALYLLGDPRTVAIAGEYSTGFQQSSTFLAVLELGAAGVGGGFAVKAVRFRKKEGLRWRDMYRDMNEDLNVAAGAEPQRWQ